MGTKCAPLVADLFLLCNGRFVMTSLSDDTQADIIEAFNSTFRYLDDLLNIDNPYFEGMVNQLHPPELRLKKANDSDNEAPFLRSPLFGFTYIYLKQFYLIKIYDKRNDFDFDTVNFPFLIVTFNVLPLMECIFLN